MAAHSDVGKDRLGALIIRARNVPFIPAIRRARVAGGVCLGIPTISTIRSFLKGSGIFSVIFDTSFRPAPDDKVSKCI